MSSRWADIGGANEVNETEPLAVFVDGIAMIVVRCGESLYAVDNLCTHDGETFGEAQVEDCQVVCPRHGAHFCLRTGAALTPRPTSRCAPTQRASRTGACWWSYLREPARMKRLTLMRHADARWKDSGVSDLERPLSRRGITAAEAMARRLAELGLVPELVLVSPARRAQQTAEILARELALPVRLLVREDSLYLAAPPELLRLARATGPLVQHLMIIAHNPGLTELAHELAPQEAPRDLNAAAAVLDGVQLPGVGGDRPRMPQRDTARAPAGAAIRTVRLGALQHSGTLTARPPWEVSL